MDQKKFWESKWRNAKKRMPATVFARRSFSVIHGKKLKTLLDVGCGDGKDAFYFARKGLKVTAVDFSRNAIKMLKRRMGGETIIPLVMDIRKLKFRNKFDVVYANLSLHYFDDKMTTKIFSEIYKLLNKGGYLFVRCKSTEDAPYGKGRKLGKDYFMFQGHKRHFFSADYMAEKLQRLKVISIRKTSSKHFRINWRTYNASFIEAVAVR